jgi:hypothetical protein
VTFGYNEHNRLTSARPHTPTTVGGTSYLYDANGNLSSGNGRNYTWNAENLPTTISY